MKQLISLLIIFLKAEVYIEDIKEDLEQRHLRVRYLLLKKLAEDYKNGKEPQHNVRLQCTSIPESRIKLRHRNFNEIHFFKNQTSYNT